MEGPHPIPQNVTSFEFHLVGDMTLKQFLYLAVGVTIAYVSFTLLVPVVPILGWPIVIFPAMFGAAFAFLPIADRPLDHWLSAYLKAVYLPTQRVWVKNGKKYTQQSGFLQRMALFQQNLIPQTEAPQPTPLPKTSLPVVPQVQLMNQTTPQTPSPSKEELQKTVELARKAQVLQAKIIQNEMQLNQIRTQTQTAGANPQLYTDQINTVMENLQKLVREASIIKTELAGVSKQEPFTPTVRPKVEVVKAEKPKPSQPTLTTLPNVINGILTDSEGNYLEGVVVVIADKNGLPVRALKTNKLGQFTGATPLPNGTYTIELEKDNLVFDVLQIELGGSVLSPISIKSKKILGNS